MDKKIAHLNMIQGVINRMAKNSFALKGWAVTLLAGLFALASKDSNKSYFLIAYLPIVTFWLLDSFYLSRERRYRSLFELVRATDEESIDFNMNSKLFKDEHKNSYIDSLLSITELVFYTPLAIVPIIAIIISTLC